jgi:hypothetical protein
MLLHKGAGAEQMSPQMAAQMAAQMHPQMPQPIVPGSNRSHKYSYSKYSAASSGTHTPSTCSGSSDLSRQSDGSTPGLQSWEPSEQERQFLLEQIQEALMTRNPQMPPTHPPGIMEHMLYNQQQQLQQQPQHVRPQTNQAPQSMNDMQPQKVPVMGSHAQGGLRHVPPANMQPAYMTQDGFTPPPMPSEPMLANASNPMFLPPAQGRALQALAPGSLEHMQMLSKIAELQQQLNAQQKLLEAATQGSGCPSIQADAAGQLLYHQSKGGKGPPGVMGISNQRMPSTPGSGGYPKGGHNAAPMLGAMPDSAGLQKNKGSNLPKDNNNKNGKVAQEQQLANSATLQTHLKALGNEDPACIFIVRKVNRLGFRSVEVLTKYFQQQGTVVKVLVAHSKVKRNQPGNAELYLRPGSLGFVLMKNAESVQHILAAGPTVNVQGTPIRVQAFSRLNGGLLEKTDEAGEDGDTESAIPEESCGNAEGWYEDQ